VYEYSPIQFTQFRLGVRKNNGIPQNNAQNATEVFHAVARVLLSTVLQAVYTPSRTRSRTAIIRA